MKKVLAFIVFSLLILTCCFCKGKNSNKKTVVKEYDFIKEGRLDVDDLCSRLFKNIEYKIAENDESYNVKYYIYVPTEEFERESIQYYVTPEKDGKWTFFEGLENYETKIINIFSEEKLRTVITKNDEIVSEYWGDETGPVFFGGTQVYDTSSTPDNLVISEDCIVAHKILGFYEHGKYTRLLSYYTESKEYDEDCEKYRYHSYFETVFTKNAVYVIYFCFDPKDESQIVVKGFECKMSTKTDNKNRIIHSFTADKYENTISLQ